MSLDRLTATLAATPPHSDVQPMPSIQYAALASYLLTNSSSGGASLQEKIGLSYLRDKYHAEGGNLPRALLNVYSKPVASPPNSPDTPPITQYAVNEELAMVALVRTLEPSVGRFISEAQSIDDIRALFLLDFLKGYMPNPAQNISLESIAYQSILNYQQTHDNPLMRGVRKFARSKWYGAVWPVAAGLLLGLVMRGGIHAITKNSLTEDKSVVYSMPLTAEELQRKKEIEYYQNELDVFRSLPSKKAAEIEPFLECIKKEIKEKGLEDEVK